ncbi:MAG: hypothetical protein GY928_16390 [Colwellia sp.]|nr:hypothetical protein [Colwellia sp.]
MATESLIVELDARTKLLDAKLISTNNKLEKLEDQTKKNDTAFMKFSKVASGVGRGLGVAVNTAKKAVVALTAVKAAVTAAAFASSKHAKEIKNNSDLMRLSVEETQAWAAATQTVGIDIEKLGDISKDTSEKIGDFLNTGGGGFQDFADAMKLTKEETVQAAEEFKGMAGADVLQAMVKQMEAAGVSSEQMSHALEGMASDTTKLIPLLTDGGAAVNQLKDDFYDTAVVLSKADVAKLGELSIGFQQLGDTFDGTLGKFSVEYADQINSMIESTQEGLKIVGDEFASGAFTDRMNSFYSAFTSSWSVAMGDNISVFDDFTGDAGEVIESLAKGWTDFALTMPINLAIGGNHVKEIFMDIVDAIVIAMGEANLAIQKGLEFVGIGGDVEGAQAVLDTINAETAARDEAHEGELERLRTEKEAILEKFALEQGIATTKREQYAADTAERMKLAAEEDQAERKRLKGKIKSNSDTKKSNAEQVKAEEKGKADLTKNAMILNEQLFNNNKAIGAGIIVAETAQNVVTSVKNSGGIPWGLPAGAAAAAMGVAQLAALKGATKGGGSISGGSGGASSQPQQPESYTPETSSLEVTEQTTTGNQTFQLVLEDGTELTRGIMQSMEEIGRNS